MFMATCKYLRDLLWEDLRYLSEVSASCSNAAISDSFELLHPRQPIDL